MKQKKTQIIFYFFLLIVLSFSTHARVVNSPGFFVGMDYPNEEFGELSRRAYSNSHSSRLLKKEPQCPRGPGGSKIVERTLKENCSAAQYSCLEGCYRCIPRSDCDNETRKKSEEVSGSMSGKLQLLYGGRNYEVS